MKCEHIREFINDRIISLNTNEYLWKCKRCGKFGEDIVGSSIISPDTQEARNIMKDRQKKRKEWI